MAPIRMIPEHVEALALADAIGALDPDEQAELAARLAELSPDDRATVAGLYDTVVVLADSVEPVTPPSRPA